MSKSKSVPSITFIALLLLAVSSLTAHPHYSKTVTAKLPAGAEVTITYNTTPANEMHAQKTAVGSFVTPRSPQLKISADIQAGSVSIPAGDYTIGVIKNSDTDWTMALYPGKVARGQAPDMSKVIKLESEYSAAQGKTEHMLIDISPGSGKMQGRAVLTLHFGSLFLAGALS